MSMKSSIYHTYGGKMKRNVNSRSDLGMLTFQIHNLSLVDDSNEELIDNLLKTYNSASRCAFKRFKSIGLKSMLKEHPTPDKRNPTTRFTDYFYKDAPVGMSDKMWREFRKDSYDRKRAIGLKHTNRFWMIDKDLGSPINGTMKSIREWVNENEYKLDSTLIHDAVMQGFKQYLAFERQLSKWKTSKKNPSFGDISSRSSRKISKDEFQLTRNSSLTIIGKKSRKGNQKFNFSLENDKMTFTFNRKRIEFDYSHNRFSHNGYDKFQNIVNAMENDGMPVTITLTKIGKNKFNLSLTYSPLELNEFKKEYISHDNDIISCIYSTDEVVCHQIMNVRKHRIIHSKTYDIGSLDGEKKNKHAFEQLKWDGKYDELASLTKKTNNKKTSIASELVAKIFRISRSYGVKNVVIETTNSRTSNKFNKSLLEFDKSKITNGNANNCFISQRRFNSLIKGHCIKNGMTLNKVNGDFIQMISIANSNTMSQAIRNACTSLAIRFENKNSSDLYLTDWRKFVNDPSMLDWVKHLLHNKRNRQARATVKHIMHQKIVEKAICLPDNRSKCIAIDEGRHSPLT